MTDDQKPLVENASDRKQIREAKHTARSRRKRELDDVRAVLKSPAGERLLRRIAEHCGTFRSVFVLDPYATAFNAGRQDVGHFLLAEIEAASKDALLQMTSSAYAPTKPPKEVTR